MISSWCGLSRRAWWIVALVASTGQAFTPRALAAEASTSNPATAVQTLSGVWRLATDPDNRGRAERWQDAVRPEAQPAPVPGVIQQVFPAYHGVAWYWHAFRLQPGQPGDRLRLRFGAVDYLADVWVNGTHIGSYEGGETPFEFDATDVVRTAGENLLAVRVLNPTSTPIDGFVLDQIPHRNKSVPPRCGSPFNSGGIMYPVTLRRVPPVAVADVFARPEWGSGKIEVTLAVRNSGTAPVRGRLELNVAPAQAGEVLQATAQETEFPVGLSSRELRLQLPQPRAWSLEDPFLYRVEATVTAPGQAAHREAVRCGFRDFRVVDGYFHLNGKRLFLKSTHTGNCMPVGQQVSVVSDFGRRDLIYAKASGFNTVRFIAGVAYPEQLDLCDELGLLVYEECFAAWLLGNSPQMGERFDRSTLAMVRRDRNHPSVALWGLLNETQDGPVFRHAVAFLPRLREVDPTRLVLLGSGRWDGQWTIGSAANPGSREWQPVWGAEGPGTAAQALGAGGYVKQAGDAHFYPGTPQTPATDRTIRDMGRDSKPVFLSEYGIGSQMNVIDEWRHFAQAGARPDLEDAAFLREQSEAFEADWKRLGFESVYPFPEDFLRESQRLHARQRSLGFNAVRSNPRLCGFNLTGMLDHAITGEGLWTYWRQWKPATFDAVADGWSPLRWCLFVEPLHVYAGRAVTVDAVLANEDVLPPGEYPARFRVFGPQGTAWEKSTLVRVPEPRALAAPAIRETFTLNGPAGLYTFAAHLERGGAPTGGRLQFHVSDPSRLPRLQGAASVWGLGTAAEQWLTARGLTCRPLTAEAAASRELVLVGKPEESAANSALWTNLTARLAQGATVLFLSGQPFKDGKAGMKWLPLAKKGRCYTFNDWLYHKDCVAQRHPVFEGLQGPGVWDWDYYGPVVPHEIFEGFDTPDETLAAAFAVANSAYPRGYASSLLIAAYRSGPGRIILNTPYLLENLDTHPAADRLLLNLIRYAQE